MQKKGVAMAGARLWFVLPLGYWTFFASTLAHGTCDGLEQRYEAASAMSALDPEIVVHEEFVRVQKLTNWLIALRGNRGPDGPYFFARIRAQTNRLHEYIQSGNTAAAFNVTKRPAREVNFAYFALKALDAQIKSEGIDQHHPKFKETAARREQLATMLGQSLNQHIRHLMVLARFQGTPHQKVADQVADVLFRQVRETNRELVGNHRKAPTPEQLWALYGKTPKGYFPHAPLAREKTILSQEIRGTVLGSLVRTVTLGGSQSVISRVLARTLPAKRVVYSELARKLGLLINDAMAYSHHYNILNTFLEPGKMPKPKEQYDQLRQAFAREGPGGDLLLVTYFRRADTVDYHQDILKHAESNRDPKFDNALRAAYAKFGTLGPLGTHGRVGPLEFVELAGHGALIYGLVQLGYWYFGDDDDGELTPDDVDPEAGWRLTAAPQDSAQLTFSNYLTFMNDYAYALAVTRQLAEQGDAEAKKDWDLLAAQTLELEAPEEFLRRLDRGS